MVAKINLPPLLKKNIMKKYILLFSLFFFSTILFAQKNILEVNLGLVHITDINLRKSHYLGVAYEREGKGRFSFFSKISIFKGSGGGWGFPDNGVPWGIKAYGIDNSYPAFQYKDDPFLGSFRNTSFKIAKSSYTNLDVGLGIRIIQYKRHQLSFRVGLSAAYAEESGISEDTPSMDNPVFYKSPIKFVIPYYASYYTFGENISFPYRFFLKETAFIGLTPLLNNYLLFGSGYTVGVVLNGGLKF